MKPKPESDTIDFVLPVGSFDMTASSTLSARVRVELGALSHQGKVRTNNEDHYLAVRFGRSLEALLTNLPEEGVPPAHEEVGYGLLVADGLGGQAAGEVASSSAIQFLVDMALHTPDWILSLDDGLSEEVMRRMGERFRHINDLLTKQGNADSNLTGMGTTLTLACSLGLGVILCHVGDSRVYLFRQGELLQLTRDMTRAQELVEAGKLTPAQAARHRLRHVLTQCLGDGGRVTAQVAFLPLLDEDRLLLCTDGLTEMLDDGQIAGVLQANEPAQMTCQALVDLALDRGGRDNVTVILAHYCDLDHQGVEDADQ